MPNFKKIFQRKGTPSSFGQSRGAQTDVAQSLPPTYGQQNLERGTTDNQANAAQAQKTDEQTAQAEGKDPEQTEQPVQSAGPSQQRVVDNVVKDKSPQQTKIADNSVFSPFWNEGLGYDLIPTSYSEVSEYTPNAISMFQILRGMSGLTVMHRDIQKRHPEYADYATGCYYAILFYVQILRARRSANELTGEESTFLRRFEREHPLQGLPVAGPLVPFFSTIVSTQVEDARYGWITPRIEATNYKATMATAPANTGEWYLQPQVPYMLSILRMSIDKFIWSRQVISRTFTAGGQDYCFLDDEDRFVPHTVETAAHQDPILWGLQINAAAATDVNTAFSLGASGLDYAYRSDMDAILLFGKHWWNSNFRRSVNALPLDYMNVGNGAAAHPDAANLVTNGATPISNLEQFLFMRKSDQITWFKDFAANAAIQCKIFKGTSNLSNIPTVGGYHMTIDAILGRPQNAAAREFDTPQAANPMPAGGHTEWYTDLFTNVIASFETPIAGISREDTIQALTFASNAQLHILNRANGTRIGGRGNNRTSQRTGPFYSNAPDIKEELYTADDRAPMRSGKPMFREFKSVVQTSFYQERMQDK